MASAAYYRKQGEALRNLARATKDQDEAYAYCLRAVEYDYLAEQAESAGQVQQHGTQPPPPPSASNQPAQQQQQVQPKEGD